MDVRQKLTLIGSHLSPTRPIRSEELLRGRTDELEKIVRELEYFHSTPFIYGHRGVGKTSLARTAAQIVTPSDREHIYVACAPGSRMMKIFKEIGEELLRMLITLSTATPSFKSMEVTLSMSPSIKASFESKTAKLDDFDNPAAAVRVIRELSALLPRAEATVVVLDELEELNENDRSDLAYFVKQVGDQEIPVKFVLVGIAENVHELIGAHESVPRYVKEVDLQPLTMQTLMDIVNGAADQIGVTVPRWVLYRIGIIGNGFPHFAHLMGKAILVEAAISDASEVTAAIYTKGVADAVAGSVQELRTSYDAATQRSEDYFKHLIWALADADVVDLRIDEWIRAYRELATRIHEVSVDEDRLRSAINNFASDSYGKIIVNTPARYGSAEMRYRYKRFCNMLMRGHVRLNAEHEGIKLGREPGM